MKSDFDFKSINDLIDSLITNNNNNSNNNNESIVL